MQIQLTKEVLKIQSDDPVPTNLGTKATVEIGTELQVLLADVFALYVKTKNFHWHVSGPHFRDYHLMFDEQADQLFAITDDIAERARKLSARTIRSIGDVARSQRLKDNDQPHVPSRAMLRELLEDNRRLNEFMRSTHAVCEEHGDVATAGLLEKWMDETDRRVWFLSESVSGE
ncbi:MAG: DNA starvation/stationary phase protection protein [Bryobacteraceae bacterium]